MNNAETMIISQGNLNHSNLYKVNPADASTTLLCDTIVHNLITGAASIYDVSGNGTEIMCSTLTGVLNTHAFNTEVVVFPNPASQLLTINWPSSFKGDMNIEVLNVLGEKVFSTLLWPVPISSGRGVGREAVDVSYLPNGVYFLKIDLEDRTVNKKFVVVHLEGGLLRAWQ